MLQQASSSQPDSPAGRERPAGVGPSLLGLLRRVPGMSKRQHEGRLEQLTQHVAATSLGRRPGNPVADAALPASSTLSGSAAYDLVLAGGRVIDPESGTDAVLNIGIVGGQIVALGGTDVVCPADAAQVRDCAGLIVAPGFIDLCEHPPPPPPPPPAPASTIPRGVRSHAHGQNNESARLQAADGVTTHLELEVGTWPVEEFLRQR